MRTRLALLLLAGLTATGSKLPECRQVQIIGYTTKKGKLDPFGLVPQVKSHLQRLGFEPVETPISGSPCQLYRCQITHTENYWRFKRDSVCLTLTSASTGSTSTGRYCGASGKTALTFEAGYAAATAQALANLEQNWAH